MKLCICVCVLTFCFGLMIGVWEGHNKGFKDGSRAGFEQAMTEMATDVMFNTSSWTGTGRLSSVEYKFTDGSSVVRYLEVKP